MADNSWIKWLQYSNQPSPRYFKKIKGAYWLKANDLARLLTSLTPEEFAGDKKSYPGTMDYPTVGLTMMNEGGGAYNSKLGAPAGTIAFSTENNPELGFYNMYDTAKQYPSNYPKQYTTQAVMAHELAHVYDTRINPYKMWSAPNYGWLKFGGLEGPVLQREGPAMKAEEDFWHELQLQKPELFRKRGPAP